MSGVDGKQRIRQLMMAGLDGELSAGDQRELERALEDDPELRGQWYRLTRLKKVTENMKLKEPPEEMWETYWDSVYSRVERGLGWVLFSAGVVVLLVYAAWEAVRHLAADANVPPVIKFAIFALVAGGLVLLYSVGREKLTLRKRDPYTEVKR